MYLSLFINMTRYTLLGTLLIVILSSCSSPKELEYKTYHNFSIQKLGFNNSTIKLDLEYYNPNNFGVTVKEAVADVYLCPFKRSDEKPLLDAMGVGRPCIATRDSGDPGQDSADVLGIPEFVADSEMSYLQIAQGLLRDAEARKRASTLIERRFNSEFSPALLGRKYIEFLSTVQSQ